MHYNVQRRPTLTQPRAQRAIHTKRKTSTAQPQQTHMIAHHTTPTKHNASNHKTIVKLRKQRITHQSMKNKILNQIQPVTTTRNNNQTQPEAHRVIHQRQKTTAALLPLTTSKTDHKTHLRSQDQNLHTHRPNIAHINNQPE